MSASIIEYLRANGEGLDADIAAALHMPLGVVTKQVAALSSEGRVICCKVTRYRDGEMIEGVSCRLAGKAPPPSRGRKPGVKPASAGMALSDVKD